MPLVYGFANRNSLAGHGKEEEEKEAINCSYINSGLEQ